MGQGFFAFQDHGMTMGDDPKPDLEMRSPVAVVLTFRTEGRTWHRSRKEPAQMDA
jgi:hypothetical protein